MSRRGRAIGFGSAALACAGLAAALAGGYRSDVQSQLGPLRSALVAREQVPARRRLRPTDAERLLEVRRIPERFVPAGTLTSPAQAVGRAAAAPIPPGAYVLAAQLTDPGSERHSAGANLDHGREPVQISVTGAEALAATGHDPQGTRVDVIVTTEPGPGGGHGRTRLAARGVELLALTEAANGGAAGFSGPGSGAWNATLALTRSEAIRLIQAENFARQVRLIPH